jgi:hypothetical protein
MPYFRHYCTPNPGHDILVMIDNTFSNIWYTDRQMSDYNNIYDKRALAPSEVALVKAISVPPRAGARIRSAMNQYFSAQPE